MRTKIVYSIVTIVAAIILGFAAPAGAQTADVYGQDPDVLDDGETRDPAGVAVVDSSDAQVLGSAQTRQLPRTGNDLAPLALAGAGAIILGTGFVLYRRRYAA